jgi:hypothetical protein
MIAIIHHFVNMLDEEKSQDLSTSSDNTNTILTPSTASFTEDDTHVKRRASPTELFPVPVDSPTAPVHNHNHNHNSGSGSGSGSGLGLGLGSGSGSGSGSGLQKRASFKKMRAGRGVAVDSMESLQSDEAEASGIRSPVKKARSSKSLSIGVGGGAVDGN